VSFQHNAFQHDAFQTGVDGAAAAEPFKPTLGTLPRVNRPSVQGGYSTVPNLLITTLAVFAAGSQLVKREATLHNAKPAPQVQAFQVPNLLTSTLSAQVAPIPIGSQQTESAPSIPAIGHWQPNRNPLLYPLPMPIGKGQIESAPPSVPIGAAQQNQSRLLLEQVVQPIPIGRQQTESAPETPRVLFWDRGTNTLLFVAPPSGAQRTESAPPSRPINPAQETQSRALLDFAVQPLPQGRQETSNLVQTPAVQVFTPPQIIPPVVQTIPIGRQQVDSQIAIPAVQAFSPSQIIPPVVTADPLPIGKQQTESAPPTTRIGDIKYARGMDPGAPAQPDPLPIGEQRTESQIWTPGVDSFRPPTIVPPVVAAQEIPIGEQSFLPVPYRQERPQIDQPANLLAVPPIASSQSEQLPQIRPSAVYDWVHPNLVIRIPIPPPPVGKQWTTSAPTWNAPVQVLSQQPIIPPIIQPIPVGRQQTESAPPLPPQVQGYEAPNATLFIPPPEVLPVGKQQTASAPIWTPPIGMAVGSTIPPDLLPPPVVIPEPEQKPAGRAKRERYIARYRGEEYEFSSYEALEDFVNEIREQQKKRPKRFRKPVKISLSPDFQEEIREYVEIPKALPKLEPSAALAQVRQIERKLKEIDLDDDEDEEILLWLS
jgi:hypothetical protein